MIGRTLSHYEILEKLGEGGMGVVYKARDSRLGRFVALKVLAPDKVADPERKRRFVQEARAASALNHPNIVTIHEIDQQDGVDFLVMEFVDGRPLSESIPARGLPIPSALDCAMRVADALEKAHAAGIVHRDLKPQNIMLCADGRVKVLDFGLAKLTDPATASGETETRTLTAVEQARTKEGVVLGTAAYMSPEQAEGKHVDSRSDIFSFGAVLYEMLTGKRAFQRESHASTMAAILLHEPAPPAEIRGELPPELSRIVARCLKKDPARRIQHMGDVKLALEELKEESTSAAHAPARPKQQRASRWTWISAGIAAGLLIAAAAWRFFPAKGSAGSPLAAVPLTTYPGMEMQPSFSPDGTQVVFAWSRDDIEGQTELYLKVLGPGNPLRLTTHPGTEWSPAWSPDGRWIAFARGVSAERSEILLMPALGGSERKLSSFAGRDYTGPSIAWLPDSKWLVVAQKDRAGEPWSLHLLAVETGEKRRLTSPPPQTHGDLAPAVSPEGRRVAFSRSPLITTSDVFVLDLNQDLTPAGEPRRLTSLSGYLSVPAWTGDGRYIVFSSGQWGNMSLWKVGATGRKESVERLPFFGDDAYSVAISRQGNRLLYERHVSDLNIWRLSLEDLKPGRAGKPATSDAATLLISSSRMEHTPAYSPDGKKIAFSSNQSGIWEIWLCDADGSNLVQLTSMNGRLTRYPAWSPDGRWIVFDSRPEGHADLFVIGVEGGKPRRLTSGASNDIEPSWSADGRWIYFTSNRSGESQIWKVPAQGGEEIEVVRQGGRRALESPDGRSLYFLRSGDLIRRSLAGGREEKVARVNSDHYALSPSGVYFDGYVSGAKTRAFYFLDFKTGRAAPFFEPSKPSHLGFSLSPDTKHLVFCQNDHSSADLMLVEGFR